MISLPDLCDEHGEVLSVLEVELRSFGGVEAFAGPVRTVRCFEDNSRVKEVLATPGDGAVLVVDGGGSPRCALLGDLIAENAVANGWAGVIVNGSVRDVSVLRALDLGVYALRAHPRRSVRRGVGDLDVPVRFGGVVFTPGAHVYVDPNGIAVAPEALPLL